LFTLTSERNTWHLVWITDGMHLLAALLWATSAQLYVAHFRRPAFSKAASALLFATPASHSREEALVWSRSRRVSCLC
jgi:hypothetical protein